MNRPTATRLSGDDARNPPTPTFTIRVGVTGHRSDKLGASTATLRETIRRVLLDIATVSRALAQDYLGVYANTPATLRLVSPLADGADILVASVASDLGFELEVPLPYSAEEFARELMDPAVQETFLDLIATARKTGSVFELDGAPGTPEAYWNVGQMVMRHSDIMIAVWDGERANGHGGTAEVAKEACAAGLPVLWIDPKHPDRITFLAFHDGRAVRDADLGALSDRLRAIVAPPSAPSQGERRSQAGRALREYLHGETIRRCWFGGLFDLLVRVSARQWPMQLSRHPTDHIAATKAEWDELDHDMEAAEVRHGLEARMLRYFSWSDNLATYYATRYRDFATYILFLSPLAVLMAVLGFLASGSAGPIIVGPLVMTSQLAALVCVLSELAILLCVLAVYGWGQHRRFHERWVDYRLVAERLRHFLFLLPLGRAPIVRHGPNSASRRIDWVDWYVRAIQREAGLFPGACSPGYLLQCRNWLNAILKSQAAYHRRNAHRLERAHKLLHGLAFSTFLVAVMLAAFHSFEAFSESTTGTSRHTAEPGGGLALLVAIGLPLLGGAIHAFLAQGQFGSSTQMSATLEAELSDQASAIESKPPLDSRSLTADAELASATMAAELADWHFVFRGKPLPSPG